MKGKKVFLANRVELEKKLSDLFPAVSLIRCYTEISNRVEKEGVKASGQMVYRMYNRLMIHDEYVCRMVIKCTKSYLNEIREIIESIETKM